MCDKKHFILSAFAYRYYQLKKNELKEIGSSIFRMFSPCRYSPTMPFYFTHHFHSLATDLRVGHVRLSRRPLSFPGALFLGLSCFGSGAAGLAPPGRSALASVPELHVSSFRHATWLNFAEFCSSGDFFAYCILLSTIVCVIAVLLVLVVTVSCLEVLGNSSCNPFYQ